MAMKLLVGGIFAFVFVVSGSSTRGYWNGYSNAARQRILRQVSVDEVMDHDISEVSTPPNETNVTEKSYDTCTSAACIIQAESLRLTMNPKADPCEDFYEYACGGWTRFWESYIPSGNINADKFRAPDSLLKLHARNLLEEEIESTDIEPIRSAKMFYTSCLLAESRKSSPALWVVKEILDQYGAWPMASDQPYSTEEGWQDNNDNFIRDFGIYALYSISLTYESDDEFPIVLSEPGTILDDFQVDCNIHSNTYRKKIANAAQFLVKLGSQNVSKHQIEQDAEEIVELERKIFKIMTRSSTSGEDIEMSVDELQREYDRNRRRYNSEVGDPRRYDSEIDWLMTFQKCFEGIDIELNGNTSIKMTEKFLEYLRKLAELLNDTNPRTVANYVYWRMISEVADKVDPYVNSMDDSARWYHCVSRHPMARAISYAFASTNYVSEEVESETRDLVTSVRNQVAKQISESGWMDELTKQAATNKLLTMQEYIGSKDLDISEEAVTSYYAGLDLTEDYEQNILIWIKWMRFTDLWRMGTSISSEERLYSFLFDAFYRRSTNSMYIPAGMLKFSLIGPEVPESISLGTLGAVIGHVISHAFDRKGIEYDENGDHAYLPRDVKKAYIKKSQCFIDQYDNYLVPGLSRQKPLYVNGIATLSENIADAAGLGASFAALSENMNKTDFNDLRLPGLENLTAEQLFFLSYGNMKCQRMTDSTLEYLYAEGKYTTHHMSVNGAVSNTVGFGKAFNCPVDSQMNPKKKCNIWN